MRDARLPGAQGTVQVDQDRQAALNFARAGGEAEPYQGDGTGNHEVSLFEKKQ